jgi:hypothetical protein
VRDQGSVAGHKGKSTDGQPLWVTQRQRLRRRTAKFIDTLGFLLFALCLLKRGESPRMRNQVRSNLFNLKFSQALLVWGQGARHRDIPSLSRHDLVEPISTAIAGVFRTAQRRRP